MIVKASAIPGSDSAYSVVTDEPDELRLDLLRGFLADCEGSEDLYLAALDRAEAGTPELNWCNHYVDAEMYPDGRVVIEKLWTRLEEDEQDNPPRIVITIAEARKLILDWIDARDKWYAERAEQDSVGTVRGK